MKKTILLLYLCSLVLWCRAQTPPVIASSADFYAQNYPSRLFKTSKGYGDVIAMAGRNRTIAINNVQIPIGSDYVHIFYDENGTLLSSSFPSGVPWVNYVIHVIHPNVAGESYSVNQTAGSITGQYNIRNAPAAVTAIARTLATPATDYSETVYILNPSDNSNISFDIIKTVLGNTTTKNTIGSFTITMSGYYNASIDVGIFNSKLHNPTYTLVNSPVSGGGMVVKNADNGDRVMTTVMGTLYFSPVVFVERQVFDMDVPLFQQKGYSVVAPAGLFERIYPTFGLSINDNTFQNIFYGINWEIIRGGSLFFGWHTGKINVYQNQLPGFTFGSTSVTQDQFNLATDTKWSTQFAIGATIDLKVVLGLLSTSVK